MMKRLDKSFYNVSAKVLAISLLGKVLVRKLDSGKTLKGRIVEIESYPEYQDISYERRNNESIEPGTSLVSAYNMINCLISSQEPDGVVLIRAIEPIVGVEEMRTRRNNSMKKTKIRKDTEIANGPTILCTAMDINRTSCNMLNLATDDTFWVEDDNYSIPIMVATSRIVTSLSKVTGDDKPYRFYIYQNPYITKHELKETD